MKNILLLFVSVFQFISISGMDSRSKTRHFDKKKLEFTTKGGMTPLHVASLYGNKRNVNCLLDLGADSNARSFNGCTPLHYFLGGGITKKSHKREKSVKYDTRIITSLLQHNAKIDVAGGLWGETPLHVAARKYNPQIIKTLLGLKHRKNRHRKNRSPSHNNNYHK